MKALLRDLVKIVGVRVSVRISGSGIPDFWVSQCSLKCIYQNCHVLWICPHFFVPHCFDLRVLIWGVGIPQ